MGKQIAQNFTIITEKGLPINGLLVHGGISAPYRINKPRYISFLLYASGEEAERNPESYLYEYQLPVTQEDIDEMMQTQGYAGLVISDKSWQLAKTNKFILDYSHIDENGNREGVLKSLDDLNADIVDIGM